MNETKRDKILKCVSGMLLLISFMIVIGSMGGFENDAITMTQFISRSSISGAIALFGWFISMFIENDEE